MPVTILLWPVEAIPALLWTWTWITSVSIPVIPRLFIRRSSEFQVDTSRYMHIHAVETCTGMQKHNFSDTYRIHTTYIQTHSDTCIYIQICIVLCGAYVCLYYRCMCMYEVLYVHVCAYVHVFFAAKSVSRINTYIYAHICTYIQHKSEICTNMHRICTTYAQIHTNTYTLH